MNSVVSPSFLHLCIKHFLLLSVTKQITSITGESYFKENTGVNTLKEYFLLLAADPKSFVLGI